MALFISNIASVAFVAALVGLSRLATTAGVLDVSEITQFFDHDKPRSISQLLKEISKNYLNTLMEPQRLRLTNHYQLV